jgi:tetratricopeptide (TPR) repeat protein
MGLSPDATEGWWMSPELRVTLARTAGRRPPWTSTEGHTVELDPAVLPFVRPTRGSLPPGPTRVRIRDLHLAFPNHQTLGTRLVLTHSTYLLQKWIDALREDDEIIATADEATLKANAPEAFQGRGVWRHFELRYHEDAEVEEDAAIEEDPPTGSGQAPRGEPAEPSSAVEHRLARAYASSSSAERLALCGDAAAAAPESAVARLALASAARESQEPAVARRALDEALHLAPDWEAVHYEDGKFWLAVEELTRARDAFRRASDLMPAFVSAASNLGATSGELGDSEAAVTAFEQALRADPDNFIVLNNIAVASRELGRLAQSEDALRRVIALAPDFVFGHYNLGHTLFLSGRYRAALEAYEKGNAAILRRTGARAAGSRSCGLRTATSRGPTATCPGS